MRWGSCSLGNLNIPILHHPIECEKTVKPLTMGIVQPVEQKRFNTALRTQRKGFRSVLEYHLNDRCPLKTVAAELASVELRHA
jgi:hypothetical protein